VKKEKPDHRATWRRREETISTLKYRKTTHNLTWFYQSNRSCVRPWEKREKLYLNFGGV